jgi:zinc protease
MFRGTTDLAPGQFSLDVAKVGGDENAYTTDDYTVYHQTVAVEQLPLVMRLEADRMANLAITDAVVGPEREVILEERRERIDNDPGSQLAEQLRAALFLNHPYHRPTIGWAHEMRGLTAEDERAVYRRWYAPNNAVLVVAGDVDLASVKALAERYYGPIPARPIPARERLSEPPPVAPRQVSLTSDHVQQPGWSVQYQAPSYRRAAGDQAYALELLSQILGGGTTSRLYRRLVVEDKVASAAGTSYDPDALDIGVFSFFASPPAGGSAAAVGAAVTAEIDKLMRDGVTEDELARAKAMLQAAAIKARDSLTEPARIIGTTLATGGTIAELESWPERIGAVTKAEIDAAARAVFRPEGAVTGLLLPKPTS